MVGARASEAPLHHHEDNSKLKIECHGMFKHNIKPMMQHSKLTLMPNRML
jgi:hypothetical protein